MKKIDLNILLKDLSGAEVADINIGKVLANAIASNKTPDTMKWMGWANKLYNGESFEVDTSDFSKLKDFIDNKSGLTNLITSQILTAIEGV